MKRAVVLLLLACGCGGTTGSSLVTFKAEASGTSDARRPFAFAVTKVDGTMATATVTLSRAVLRVGAVYLNDAPPISGAAQQPCISSNLYIAEAYGPLNVDLLSDAPQPFPLPGEGTETLAHTCQVWLSSGDPNTPDDPTVILRASGTAVQGGETFVFTASVTIGQNRALRTPPAMPGANPICEQRIVTPIYADITPKAGGTLALQIDPRPLFTLIDFTRLTRTSTTPSRFVIPDDQSAMGEALFKRLHSSFGVYRFTWRN